MVSAASGVNAELLRATEHESILNLYRLNLQGFSRVARADFAEFVRGVIWAFNIAGRLSWQSKTRARRALACIGWALSDVRTSPDMPTKSADKDRLLSGPQVA